MTITLVPEIEARLCERAARDGKDLETLVNALLADRLQDDEAAREEAADRALLADRLQDDEAAREEAADRALLAAGLINHNPPPRDPSKAERPRITVLGEPVSETIMRDWR